MRRAWELTQPELATLLEKKSSSFLSRIEDARHWPSAHALIASTILFGHSIEYLFKSLYDAVQEHVEREVYELHQKLAKQSSPKAKRKAARLAEVLESFIEKHRRK